MKKIGATYIKENRQLFKVVGSFVLLAIVASVCLMSIFIWVFRSDVFGWFVTGRTPLTNDIGLSMSSEYALDLSVSTDGAPAIEYNGKVLTVPLDNIFCGAANAQTLTLTHTNNDPKDLYISWFFGTPNGLGGAEIPYYSDNLYYYFGSQIAITDISIIVNDVPLIGSPSQVPGEGKFLLETSAQGAGQVSGVNSEITSIPQLDVVNGLLLESGATMVITITFAFVDNGLDQSIYQNFGGECSRILYYKAVEKKET